MPKKPVQSSNDSSKKTMKVEYGSDLAVSLLRQLGVDYAFYTPGRTLTTLMDSIANPGDDREPQLVLTTHENIAVGMATGYAFAKGRTAVAMVHAVPGIVNAALGIFTAWIYRSPVVIIAGHDTYDTAKRTSWLQGTHAAIPPNALVRGYVKWDDAPATLEGLADAIIRAHMISSTEPGGPTFISVTQEALMAQLPKTYKPPVAASYPPPVHTGADPAAVEMVAHELVNARNPLVLTDALGRYPKGPALLVQLAELLALPVVDMGDRFNLPNTHPMNVTTVAEPTFRGRSELVSSADVILSLEVPALKSAFEVTEGEEGKKYVLPDACRIIDVTKWNSIATGLITDYFALQRTDFNVQADADVFLEQLLDRCRGLLAKDRQQSPRKERHARIRALHESIRKKSQKELEAHWNDRPISMARLAAEVWSAIKDRDWVWVGGRLGGWPWRLWEVTRPDQFVSHYRSGALGQGLPMAVGAAFAHRDRLCVNLQPDGDFMMNPGALWTAAHHRIPMLNILANNRAYYADTYILEDLSAERGRHLKDKYFGTGISNPPIDYASLARSMGCGGIGPIQEPGQLTKAIKEGVDTVLSESKPVVIDVLTEAAHN